MVEELHTFYLKYLKMNNFDRTFYEIIRGGLPCRLYFDIEYDKTLNASVDGDEAMAIFKKYLVMQIHSILGIEISQDVISGQNVHNRNIIELDATNAKKFSRHIIVLFPDNVVFNHNQHVEVFVKMLCDQIRQLACINESDHNSKLTGDALELRKLFI